MIKLLQYKILYMVFHLQTSLTCAIVSLLIKLLASVVKYFRKKAPS